ncbi:MAG: metallophosphoesterase [Myxococcales bacterium]|nr:metallophosphoesterase [Myxococcales bacterium]
MTFKFMHSADIHLDSPLKGLERYDGAPSAEIRSATRQAFVRLVDCCIDEKVTFLLIVGDLFDGDWKDFNTGLFFNQQMLRLKEREIRVFIVRGNHDAVNSMTKSLQLPSNVREFSASKPETIILAEHGVALHGQSYANADVQHDLSSKYPPPANGMFNIGLLHTSADGSAKEHAVYAPCAIQGLVDRGYDYWALGHVHRRQVLRSDPFVVFPGNLQGRHIRETGPKGATLVTVADRQATLDARSLDVMRWYLREVALDHAQNAQHAVDLVFASLEALRRTEAATPLAVRVRLFGATPAHRELIASSEHYATEIRARAAELEALWVEKVIVDTRAPIDIEELRRQSTPLGELLRTIAAQREDPAALDALVAELSPMQQKFAAVPADDRPPFDTASAVRDALAEVEQLLVPMLLDSGETP